MSISDGTGLTGGAYQGSPGILNQSGQSSFILSHNTGKSCWFVLLLFSLVGGLGLFLFGMMIMSNGLQKSAGSQMRSILSKLTYNRYIALVVGAFVTMILQSSSATTVMLVSFVNSRLLRFRQTIGIFLGAAVGSTVTAQIIALRITDYALLLIGTGFFVHISSKKTSIKNLGESILGFGILFFGMHIMSETMYPLRSFQPFLDLLIRLENPVTGILAGAVLTAIIQSSAAFIGIMIILSVQGLLTMESVIPLLIGANLGTAITAILASLQSTRESKQVALAYTMFKASGAIILIWWIPEFIQLVERITSIFIQPSAALNNIRSSAMPHKIANAHTIYNLILAGVFLPFVGPFEKLINLILPAKSGYIDIYRIKYLDESMIKTPLLALNLAKQEVLRMMRKVFEMTELIIVPFLEKKTSVMGEIEDRENQVDFLRDSINEYLLKITRESAGTSIMEEAFQMTYAVKEFEQMGDIISTNLKEKAIEWCNSSACFSAKGKEELIEYHRLTLDQISKAIELYHNYDPEDAKKVSLRDAKKIKNYYKEYRNHTFELEKHHFERLKGRVKESLKSSKTHLELITMLKVIGSHATNTARIFLTQTTKT
ncbi:MAG: Na/Pi cotransporter family protein [Bacteroidales bacterium]|nr:Na/Pi cotransporter family protein [Bacteroidales bacterium]